jgi:hypothetical protein
VVQFLYDKFSPKIFSIEDLAIDKRAGMIELTHFLNEFSPQKFEDENMKETRMNDLENISGRIFGTFRPLLEALEIIFGVPNNFSN